VGIFVTLTHLPQALNSQVPLPHRVGPYPDPSPPLETWGILWRKRAFTQHMSCNVLSYAMQQGPFFPLPLAAIKTLHCIFALLNFELMLDRLCCPSHRSRSLRAGWIRTERQNTFSTSRTCRTRGCNATRGVNRPSPKNAKRIFFSCRSFQTVNVKPPHPSGRSLAAKVQGA
jgi:hypothetical protein